MSTSPRSIVAFAGVGGIRARTRNRFVVVQSLYRTSYPTARSNCTTMFTRGVDPTLAISRKSSIPGPSRLLSAPMYTRNVHSATAARAGGARRGSRSPPRTRDRARRAAADRMDRNDEAGVILKERPGWRPPFCGLHELPGGHQRPEGHVHRREGLPAAPLPVD